MSAIILGLGYASWYMFRKGGSWNPDLPSLTDLPYIPDMPQDFTELPYLPKTPEVLPDTITETKPASEPNLAPSVTVIAFCNSIALYEGGPGDANHRNNNPGNCKYNPSGYLPMYGVVRKSPAGFAIFRDWDTGMLYLRNMVRGMIHKRPEETIHQFISRYAPTSDNNDPLQYATFIANSLGVAITFKMGGLV